MKITLGKAYEKLNTELIEVKIGKKSLVTNDHLVETDEDGECLVVARMGEDTNVVLVCRTDKQALVMDDQLRFIDDNGQKCEIKFLETRPINKLRERIILG
jgi:maltodextrin utilization protein YvdJ